MRRLADGRCAANVWAIDEFSVGCAQQVFRNGALGQVIRRLLLVLDCQVVDSSWATAGLC